MSKFIELSDKRGRMLVNLNTISVIRMDSTDTAIVYFTDEGDEPMYVKEKYTTVKDILEEYKVLVGD